MSKNNVINMAERLCDKYIEDNGDCIGCRYLIEDDWYHCSAGFIIESSEDLGADLDYIERIDKPE